MRLSLPISARACKCRYRKGTCLLISQSGVRVFDEAFLDVGEQHMEAEYSARAYRGQLTDELVHIRTQSDCNVGAHIRDFMCGRMPGSWYVVSGLSSMDVLASSSWAPGAVHLSGAVSMERPSLAT